MKFKKIIAYCLILGGTIQLLVFCSTKNNQKNNYQTNLSFDLLESKIVSGDTLFFRELVNNNISLLMYKDSTSGRNLAHIAFMSGKREFIYVLDESHINFFEKDSNNVYPVSLMIDWPDQLDIILTKHENLVNNDVLAQLNTFYYRGNTRDNKTLAMLIKHGLNFQDSTTKGACFKLIEYGDISNIKFLNKNFGIKYNFYFETGLAPIHYAAFYHYPELVNYFYSIGIDRNIRTKENFKNLNAGITADDILSLKH